MKALQLALISLLYLHTINGLEIVGLSPDVIIRKGLSGKIKAGDLCENFIHGSIGASYYKIWFLQFSSESFFATLGCYIAIKAPPCGTNEKVSRIIIQTFEWWTNDSTIQSSWNCDQWKARCRKSDSCNISKSQTVMLVTIPSPLECNVAGSVSIGDLIGDGKRTFRYR